MMRVLWRIVLGGRLKSRARDSDLYAWRGRFNRDGLTPTLRLDLREILIPRVVLREPFRLGEESTKDGEAQRISELVDWEIVLSADHVHSALRDLSDNPNWQATLPDVLVDATLLLRDALDLMRELGSADDRSDLSYIHQPAIDEHPQNKEFQDWTALIDLNRDAWLATAEKNPEMARLVAETWWHMPYPLFKRLAFFAAARAT
jgi:hypothetical protein